MKNGELLIELEKVKDLLTKLPDVENVTLQNISSYLDYSQMLKERVIKMVKISEQIKKDMGIE